MISLVVPTRNRSRMLADCLKSLRASEFAAEEFEILVVDDGSTDETQSTALAFVASSGELRARYLNSSGRGLNAARNMGVSEAQANLIVFTDDDVEVPPTWLNAYAAGASRYPDAGCFGGPIRLRLEGPAPRMCGRERLGETELYLGANDSQVRAVWGANMAVRRWAVDMVGPFNEGLPLFGDEEEWEIRLQNVGVPIMYLPDAWLWHRRTRRDLRLTNLIRTRFRKGVGEIALERATGKKIRLRDEFVRIPRYLAHAVRRRCYWGVLATSLQIGRIWAAIRNG